MTSERKIGIRPVGLNETDTMKLWGERLLATGVWKDNVYQELLRTEFRVAAYLEDGTIVGLASIWPDGDPDGYDWYGHMWFDHLVGIKVPGRRIVLQEPLYDAQMVYAMTQSPQRRILRAPANQKVVDFSTKKGWKPVRQQTKKAPHGVFELPRAGH
jgi:hypothetical protein